MQLPSNKELQWFDNHNKPRPSHEEHGVVDSYADPLSEFIQQKHQGHPRNWHMEGNQLTCDTDFGPFCQTMPTNLILIGIDEKGLPKFKVL